MKTILVQTKNSRGKETRISTFENEMKLNVYFKGENNEIRAETIILRRTDGGSLRIESQANDLLLQTEGDVASKLN
jgi:hypothetical protein